MLVEISLKLLLGLLRVDYKFPPCPERQLAHIAIGGVRSAANESNDPKLAVRHDSIIAGRYIRSQLPSAVTRVEKLSCVIKITAIPLALPLACGGFYPGDARELSCSRHFAGLQTSLQTLFQVFLNQSEIGFGLNLPALEEKST